MELDPASGRVSKITVPPAFGLTPVLSPQRKIDLQRPEASSHYDTLELGHGGLLSYFERWLAANEVFDDDIRLESVIEWPNGDLSLGVTQPQYHGSPATAEEIRRFFIAAGWQDLTQKAGRSLYYNYAFHLIAIDAEPRNCFINEGAILPFDVVLRHPDSKLSSFLGLYPDD